MRVGLALCLTMTLSTTGVPQKRAAVADVPAEFVIGRHTFFDFGPPTDYYELLFVQAAPNGTSVHRILLTPPANVCVLPAKLEISSGTLPETVAEIFGSTSPCAITEKELRRERKRCKNCLVFSGVNVVMQVRCGGRERVIRADILDRDMFDPAAHTPSAISWTMGLLQRLDKALGPGVMDKPMFATPAEGPARPIDTGLAVIPNLAAGNYDSLFPKAPDKLSDLYRAAQTPAPVPTVRLANSTPVSPTNYAAPVYPPIARVAHVEGDISFHFTIDEHGAPTNITIDAGPKLLRGTVEYAAGRWQFSPGRSGEQVQAVIEFRLNCAATSQ